MKPLAFVTVFIAGALVGCMEAGPPIGAQSPAPPEPRRGLA